MERIYVDANATYGLHPEVLEMLKGVTNNSYLNPSAVHQEGQQYRSAIDAIRISVYEALDISEKNYHLIFNSGATEGNATAINSLLWQKDTHLSGTNIITSSIEHASVKENLSRLSSVFGIIIKEVVPNGDDEIFINDVLNSIDENTKLVSVMWVNNESGQILPVAELFRQIREKFPEVLLHTDGVQAVGKIPLCLDDFPFDFFTCSAHKFGALPGVGITLVNRALELSPLLLGGSQESRWRAGTENVPGIFSLGPAISGLKQMNIRYQKDIRAIRDEFERALKAKFPEIQIIAEDRDRVANTSLMLLPGVNAADLVVSLDLQGVSCSTGSACSSGKQLGAKTVIGMGYPEHQAQEVVRFSFRSDFTEHDLPELLRRVSDCMMPFLNPSGVAV